MARGFGTTFGTASTDVIQTALTANAVGTRSYWMWFKWSGLASVNQRLFQQIVTTNGQTIFLENINAPAFLHFQANFSFTSGIWQSAAGSLPAGIHSLGLIYDSSSTANNPTGYIDGVKATWTNIVAPSGSYGTATTNLYIGNTATQDRNLDGWIADVAVWTITLTDAEFAALRSGARPKDIRPASLLGYWPLDGLASPEPDLSGNALNGTLTGTALQPGPPVMMFTPRWPQPAPPPRVFVLMPQACL